MVILIDMNLVEIYTDASFNPKTNLAGGGILWLYPDKTQRESVKLGWVKSNVQAEMLTIIHALNQLKTPHEATVYTDIQQFVDIVRGKGKIRHCPETWEQYWIAVHGHIVRLEWIGRNSNQHTMEVHNLARSITFARKYNGAK